MLPSVDATYVMARSALILPLRHGIRWTIEGAQMIPAHGPVILASNHVSYLDPLVLAYLADQRHRRVRFLAKAELFDKRGLGSFLRSSHQIPVHRGTADAAASLDAAVAALRAGECVTVFPEGTISLDLEPMAGKSGSARLAQQSGVPVLPVGLWGLQRVLYKGRKPNWRTGVAETVAVGAPVRVGADEDVRVATDRIMTAICAQVSRARELYPQTPGEGDDGWWVRSPESARLRSCMAGAPVAE
jgi:1-acyl-sn-glycerol-3-phosphate acyltransferase